MPANIFGSRFLGRREPAWHGLGTVFSEPLSASEAAKRANLLYVVDKFPITVDAYGQAIETDQFVLVREPTNDDPVARPFGVVGKEYTVIQNRELAKILDPLSVKWPVETAGALGYGEIIFLSLDAGSGSVANEEIRKFFLISDSKGGGKTLRIAFTPVRVVCQNTLILGLSSASMLVHLKHWNNIESELNLHILIAQQMQKLEGKVMESLNALTLKKIVEEQVEDILAIAYPLPSTPRKVMQEYPPDVLSNTVTQHILKLKESYESRLEAWETIRAGATMLYDRFNDEQPNLARTGWALYNAVVETEDYRRGGNAQENALFGARAATKARTFDALMAI